MKLHAGRVHVPAGPVEKVDAYLAKVKPPYRAALDKLRKQIRSAAPKAEEGFGYGLPGFYQDGPLWYYGVMKAHCGLYGQVPADLADDLEGFVHSKGTIRFTPDKPLPAALVKRLVKAKLAANQARAAPKPRAKR